MFNMLFAGAWSIHPSHVDACIKSINLAVKAGPVEDAERDRLPISKTGNIAVVSMRGPMLREAGWLVRYGFAGTRDTARALEAAAADDDIDSILWVVDSPGGSVAGLNELADTVRAVKAKKPILVQVDGMMASAALYVTAHASEIIAGKRDLIGSIGVRTMLYDYSGMLEKGGVKAIPIDTGEHKSAGAFGTEITESQQAEIQRIVDGYFADFKNEVMTGRGLSEKEFNALADGRIFFADEEPVNKGLIDSIANKSETMRAIIDRQNMISSAKARHRLLYL
jgi:signal peptide peptidase SppA